MTSGPFVALIETLLDWIGPFFSTYGYILIVAATMLEFGVRGRRRARRYHPGHRGVYAARGDLSLPWVIVLGALGTMAGESIGYWLGHRYGEALLRRLPFADRAQDKIDRARESFSRNDSKVLLVGRFASGLRVIVPFTAGMSQTTSYRRFMAFVIPTAIVWAVSVSLLGYLLGENVGLIDTILSRFGWGVLALVVLAVAGNFLWRRVRSRRSSRT